MGKRKLHGYTYYQCDWTGFPMRNANCFMPTWTAEGKLVKRGTYCNWEAVLSHCKYLNNNGDTTYDVDRVKDFVSTQTGGQVCFESVDFTNLEHFKHDGSKNMDMKDYHAACCYMTNEVFVVKINEAGHSFEILMDTNDGKLDFNSQIKQPPLTAEGAQPNMFQSYRKGKHKDMELCVFYHAGKNGCELNALASSLFKMQIYGEVLLVQCSKEACFLPRERFVSYMLADFQDNFLRKRKRPVTEQTSLRPEEYNALKVEMEASLSTYEKQASSLALPPAKLAKAARMPPPDGRQLAKLVKHQRENPPPLVAVEA